MLKSVDSGRDFLDLALGSNSYHVLSPPLPEFLRLLINIKPVKTHKAVKRKRLALS